MYYFLKKNIFFIAILFFSFSSALFAQNNNTSLKEISGTITNLNEPLANVNILIKGTTNGTKTNNKGHYIINAKIGDIINYSYVGFNTMSIIVEDVTSTINIKMTEKVNELAETVVTARKTQRSVSQIKKKRGVPIMTAVGMINPDNFPGKSSYFDKNDFIYRYNSFSEFYRNLYKDTGKFITGVGKSSGTSRYLPGTWDVDGIIYYSEPPINFNRIIDIHVIEKGATKWGVMGGVVIVRTLDSPQEIAKRKEAEAEKHRNQNYYSNDAKTTTSETTFSSSNLTKSISGKVTHLFTPIPNVNITIKGTSKGTKTNTKGEYSLQANVGDILEYSHISYTTVAVMIEDITSTLNIEMTSKVNELAETLVKARIKSKRVSELEKKLNVELKTPFGNFNPKKSGFAIPYIAGKDLNLAAPTIADALNGKYAGIRIVNKILKIRGKPAIYVVDGIQSNSLPTVNLADIEDVYVVKIKRLVIIKTKMSFEVQQEKREAKEKLLQNQDYYNDDALINSSETTFSSSNLTKSISGKVTHLFAPVTNVNITIKGTSKGTKTNNNGEYNLQANVGDILEYSHINYTAVAIMVEDITSTLNIELQEKDNKLNAVVVKARIDQKAIEFEKKMNVELKTSFGTFNPMKSGHSIKYISGKELNNASPNIVYALNGKVAGLKRIDKKLYFRGERRREAIYVVDGLETKTRFALDLDINNIEDVYTIPFKNLIIIRTVNSLDVISEKRKAKEKQYQNQNYYNADAVTTSDDATFSSTNIKNSQPKYIITKNISGKVTYLDAPLPLVNIKIVGKNTGVKTSPNGAYNIEANVGDIIQYSHIGFATVSIIVEDLTEVLDIEMVLKENELSAVTVTTDGKLGKTLEQAKKREKTFNTSRGNIDPKRSGFALSYFDGTNVSAMYSSLGEALDGKMPGVKYDHVAEKLIVKPKSSINTPLYPIWDVDGVIYEDEPPMDLNNIKDVRILKTLAGTNRYGSAGAGGVVLVQTINGDFNPIEAKRRKIAEQYTNKDYYANDASQISLASLNSNTYADALEQFPSKQKAYIYYDEKLKKQLPNYADHLAIAQKFVSHFNDLTLSTQIFKEQIERNNKNPEVLKAIAFHLQTIGRTREAIDAYEHAFKLRPQYAQSYRDLANAYMENNQFKKSWRLYMSYIIQGNDVNNEGIGELIYNEMEWLYFSRRNQTDIKEKFVPKSENLFDFRNDVRIIVEWNSSEAEFDLEFVNPELRSYVFDHSLASNQELITDEKQKGYSSKEFFIDDIGIGEWLINITYKGNKKPEPTYFKVSKYYNWGKASQTQDISVYKFQNEREKIQLMQLNKQMLLTSN